ncbi:30S ribosomal protein S17 [Candidatus Bathyarchaeota archaeon RBG_16_57_9]|nr:small subunit ribosomal protein S17 [uncultured archaeon]OGD45195.1 MAG: 30S ribosomal protein S17 [Candidatus Bathyarchaeota archaeon RBG_16_57_9]OGD54098.1 MAG: 30S ribosomal protein S17 [Candidatus Bathyarchaeota archaeon RBG_13_60_20]
MISLKKPEQDCSEPDCPFHGNLKVRGRVFEGTVVSTRMQRTVVVRLEYTKYNKKYERYARMSSKITAHSTPCVPVKVGDLVRIAECRPLSKTKSFVVVELVKEA